jgi:hypothetical protein
MSKVKSDNIFRFLKYDFLFANNTFFALEPTVKKILSIKISIFYSLSSLEAATAKV